MRERLRWYFEDFMQYSNVPSTSMARQIEQDLSVLGAELFSATFKAPEARRIWEMVRSKLRTTRIEIEDAPEFASLPWEAIREPNAAEPIAVAVREFVRIAPLSAQPRGLQRYSPPLRILLVISRPDGAADVPYRSVANSLIRTAKANPNDLDLHVLRPPTLDRLCEVLRSSARQGRPFDIVHIDSHGIYADASGTLPPSTALLGESLGPRGYLILESRALPEDVSLVDGATLGKSIAEGGVDIVILNACRSGYSDVAEPPSTAGGEELADASQSLASELMSEGVGRVLAMRYDAYVSTAEMFIGGFYESLLHGRSFASAATVARRHLYETRLNVGPNSLDHWLVPVVYDCGSQMQPLASPSLNVAGPASTISWYWASGQIAPQEEQIAPQEELVGRDGTILTLDRAFETHRVVLLHGWAGEGKSSTALQYCKWLEQTGGLRDPLETADSEAVLWISLGPGESLGSIHENVSDLLVQSDSFATPCNTQARCEARFFCVIDGLETLGEAGNSQEHERFRLLLALLLERDRASILLTSRDEESWLGEGVRRVHLTRMSNRDEELLATSVAKSFGKEVQLSELSPLFAFSRGNPMLLRAALHNYLTSEGLESHRKLVTSLDQPGWAPSEELGRKLWSALECRTEMASLREGILDALTSEEMSWAAILHLFQDIASFDTILAVFSAASSRGQLLGHRIGVVRSEADAAQQVIRLMAAKDAPWAVAVPTREQLAAMMRRLCRVGAARALSGDEYELHPALPLVLASTYRKRIVECQSTSVSERAFAFGCDRRAVALIERSDRDSLDRLEREKRNLFNAWSAVSDEAGHLGEGCAAGLLTLYSRRAAVHDFSELLLFFESHYAVSGTEDVRRLLRSMRCTLLERQGKFEESAEEERELRAAEGERAVGLSTEIEPGVLRRIAGHEQVIGTRLVQAFNIEAVDHLRRSFELFERLGDSHGQALAANELGAAYKDLAEIRDIEAARSWFAKSLLLADPSARELQATIFGNLGLVASTLHAQATPGSDEAFRLFTEAEANYQALLDLSHESGHDKRASAYLNFGNTCVQQGESALAKEQYQAAIGEWQMVNNHAGIAMCQHNIGVILASEGRHEDALIYLRGARDSYSRAGLAESPNGKGTDAAIRIVEEALLG